MKKLNIAIDGPSGSGKSTLAKDLSKALGIMYLDTGAMYRAIGLWALESGIDTRDEEEIRRRLPEIELTMEHEGGIQTVFLSGREVTDLIRTPEVSMAASDVSSLPCVREKLVSMQREIAAGRDIVLDGRDIGTNVLPNANYKFFTTASNEIRARRRYNELKEKGMDVDFDDVFADVIKRDKQDTERALNPLRPADDAIIIDTGGMTPEETVDHVLELMGSAFEK
ncbi:MAG: (d)CMP kinase [Christensenellales bacterium]|jgi:cytidylate kinase